MPPKKASSCLNDVADAASQQVDLRIEDRTQPPMAEASPSVQLISVIMDQFNLFFQQVQTLTIAVQAVQTAFAPPPMVPQPSQTALAQPTMV